MSLIQCPDCSKEVSTDAKSCPHCGRPKELTFFEKLDSFGKGSGSVGRNLTAFITVPIVAVFLIVMLSGGCPGPK